MGEDLSQGAKIGVILIILCAIIAIVFSIMSIMKNITTQSTQDLQSSLASMSSQKYDDYDQREVTGAQVISACKLFQDQPISVYVVTNRNKTVGAGGSTSAFTFNNYGLKNSELGLTANDATKLKAAGFSFTSGKLQCSTGYGLLEYPSDMKAYNNNRSGMNSRSSTDYVGNTSKFMSYLCKNKSGDITAIVFDEL